MAGELRQRPPGPRCLPQRPWKVDIGLRRVGWRWHGLATLTALTIIGLFGHLI